MREQTVSGCYVTIVSQHQRKLLYNEVKASFFLTAPFVDRKIGPEE